MACRLRFRLCAATLCSINRIEKTLTAPLPALRAPKVLDPLRERIRYLHYSLRTGEVYAYWVRVYIRFHGIRHPAIMAEPEAMLRT